MNHNKKDIKWYARVLVGLVSSDIWAVDLLAKYSDDADEKNKIHLWKRFHKHYVRMVMQCFTALMRSSVRRLQNSKLGKTKQNLILNFILPWVEMDISTLLIWVGPLNNKQHIADVMMYSNLSVSYCRDKETVTSGPRVNKTQLKWGQRLPNN